VVRELSWALPSTAREVRGWRTRAQAIADPCIREDALSSLANKRGHTDGAALFTILPAARNLSLLRLLVALEIAWDFLDCVNERGAEAGQVNGKQLHLALLDALDPDRPAADYYLYHPFKEDGDYLSTLVAVCRSCCGLLPAFELVRPLLVREAIRAQVLGINHDLDPERRDASLEAWAAHEFPDARVVTWYELSGAASASLTVHALLALAAESGSEGDEVAAVYAAYLPWISTATTMLDSYVDQLEDATVGDHSYVAHYPSADIAAPRIRHLIRRSLAHAGALRNGECHKLIVVCMVAMYLSKDSARATALRATTDSFVRAAGSLTGLLLPVLRLWRITYGQRSN
jgi:tetraprenyl-beta-curcumene synthase